MAIKIDDDSAFWTSFCDLLTALFIVTLVLFVISYKRLTAERDKLRVNATNYERIAQMEAAIHELANDKHFVPEPQFKRYVLSRQIGFAAGDAHINPAYDDYLRDAGAAIASLMNHLKADPKRKDARYLIVIGGMASNDQYKDNFQLSYRRALALYDFWKQNRIVFDPNVCEVIISGSGTAGVGRFAGADETKNQRFLIQIMPKVNF